MPMCRKASREFGKGEQALYQVKPLETAFLDKDKEEADLRASIEELSKTITEQTGSKAGS